MSKELILFMCLLVFPIVLYVGSQMDVMTASIQSDTNTAGQTGTKIKKLEPSLGG